MKFIKYILLILIVSISCKTAKNVLNSNGIVKKISAKEVVKKHILANFDRKTINAKLKANFDNGKEKLGFKISLRIQKDEVIYLKATKAITIFKAKITPNSVQYYSPYNKDYFEGDFLMIQKLLGAEVDFHQLQNLFLGQAIQDLKKTKQTVKFESNSYVLSPKKQEKLFDVFFKINAKYFKIDEQSVVNSIKNKRLDVKYPSYNLVDETVFPSAINIVSKQSDSSTTLNLTFKSVTFDTRLSMPFTMPKNYKKIQF